MWMQCSKIEQDLHACCEWTCMQIKQSDGVLCNANKFKKATDSQQMDLNAIL